MRHEPQNITPSPFVAEWARALTPAREPAARALDVAMGRGRHAILLARLGWRAFGVDIDLPAIAAAAARARRAGLAIHAWCADLNAAGALPAGRFDLIVVSRYLQRDLFAAIRSAVVPGGTVLYETFTAHQREHGTGPKSAAHLLEPGELRDRFAGFDVRFYEEIRAPDALARLAATRPLS